MKQGKRFKVRSLLQNSLMSRGCDEKTSNTLASSIENELFRNLDSSNYTRKVRSLVFNIKDIKNEKFYQNIINNQLSDFHLLSVFDIASDDLKLIRKEARNNFGNVPYSLNENPDFSTPAHLNGTDCTILL